MLGRIVVYSITGCPHCMAAKALLKDNGLEYLDIGVDKFQPFVREWVQNETGKTSVPQIFFNSTYIGGNHELQEQWKDDSRKEELLKILESEPDQAKPLIPHPKDGIQIDDSELPEDEVLNFIAKAQQSQLFKPSKKGWFCTKPNGGEGVKGEDILSWMKDSQDDLEDDKARELLNKAVDRGFLITQDRSNLEEAIFVRYQPVGDAPGLNRQYPVETTHQLSAPQIAQNIRKLILKLFSQHISADGKFVDYKGMAASQHWPHFLLMVAQLQQADLHALTREQRLAFFINMYNVLVIHGTVVNGVPGNHLTRYKFFSGVSYVIGGKSYSLNDIENGILRNNRKSMGTLYMKPFSNNDERLKLAIDPVDARIHFALNCGARSCPPIKTFSSEQVDSQLDLATKAFLENDEGVKLDEENSTIHLSQLFNWYEQDFGGSREAVLDWIAGYLDTGKLATMKSIRDKVDFKVKYLVYDWGNNEKKE